MLFSTSLSLSLSQPLSPFILFFAALLLSLPSHIVISCLVMTKKFIVMSISLSRSVSLSNLLSTSANIPLSLSLFWQLSLSRSLSLLLKLLLSMIHLSKASLPLPQLIIPLQFRYCFFCHCHYHLYCDFCFCCKHHCNQSRSHSVILSIFSFLLH